MYLWTIATIMLKAAGARNIKEYNSKFLNHQLNPEEGHEFMPYIVVIIDEFGDLILTAGKRLRCLLHVLLSLRVLLVFT